MKQYQIVKRANSKGQLAKAILMYQQALMHYAKEENWAVKGELIVWLGDDDPTYIAEVVLGKRKPKISNEEMKRDKSVPSLEPSMPIQNVREPDKPPPTQFCGAYKEHWAQLGKPEDWQGCKQSKGHEGNHLDYRSIVIDPPPDSSLEPL